MAAKRRKPGIAAGRNAHGAHPENSGSARPAKTHRKSDARDRFMKKGDQRGAAANAPSRFERRRPRAWEIGRGVDPIPPDFSDPAELSRYNARRNKETATVAGLRGRKKAG